MKHVSACLLLLSSLCSQLPAQAQQPITAEQVAWSIPGVGSKSVVDASGNIWTRLNNAFRQYNPQGKLNWEKSISAIQVSDFGLDSLGNLYLSGWRTTSTTIVAAEKYDQQQTLVWSKDLSTPANGWANSYAPISTVLPWGGIIVSLQAYQYKNSFPLDNVHVQLNNKGEEIDQAVYRSYGYSSGTIDLQPPLLVGSRGIALSSNNVDKFLKGYGELAYFSGQLFHTGRWGYSVYPVAPRTIFPTEAVYDSTRILAQQKQILTDGKTITSVVLFSSSTPYVPLPTPLTYTYGVVKQDTTTGKVVSLKFNTPAVTLIGKATSRLLDANGNFYVINRIAPPDRTAQPAVDTSMLVFSQIAPDFTLRSTQALGSVLTPLPPFGAGYESTRDLRLLKRLGDGSFLLTGATSGTMTIGGSSFVGTGPAPTRFLIKVTPNLLQLTTPATPICLDNAAAVSVMGRYKGYFEQRPVLQLITSGGSFTQPVASATVPLSRTAALADTTVWVTFSTPGSLSVGVYQVRVVSQMPQYTSTPISLTVQATPMAPTVALMGEELVATGPGNIQWYDGQNKPITGAADSRYKPSTPGSYYAVATANGCASLPSAALPYVITAIEPAAVIQIYPNPATDRLFVRWPMTTPTAGRIRLTDAQGRLLGETTRTGDVTEVAVQGNGGILFVQLQVDAQPVQVHKVLVQRP